MQEAEARIFYEVQFQNAVSHMGSSLADLENPRKRPAEDVMAEPVED